MKDYSNIVNRIIQEQELIIGPLAWKEASKIEGFNIDVKNKKIQLQTGKDWKMAINNLVNQYKHLFGDASVDVCKDAVRDLVANMDNSDIPSELK